MRSVGDDCPSGSFSAIALQLGVAMAFAAGLPDVLLDELVVAHEHPRQQTVVVLHHVPAFGLHHHPPLRQLQLLPRLPTAPAAFLPREAAEGGADEEADHRHGGFNHS